MTHPIELTSRESVEKVIADIVENEVVQQTLLSLLAAKEQAEGERDRQKVTIEGMAETNARVVTERDEARGELLLALHDRNTAEAQRDALKALGFGSIAAAELAKLWMNRSDEYLEHNRADYDVAEKIILAELARAKEILK